MPNGKEFIFLFRNSRVVLCKQKQLFNLWMFAFRRKGIYSFCSGAAKSAITLHQVLWPVSTCISLFFIRFFIETQACYVDYPGSRSNPTTLKFKSTSQKSKQTKVRSKTSKQAPVSTKFSHPWPSQLRYLQSISNLFERFPFIYAASHLVWHQFHSTPGKNPINSRNFAGKSPKSFTSRIKSVSAKSNLSFRIICIRWSFTSAD